MVVFPELFKLVRLCASILKNFVLMSKKEVAKAEILGRGFNNDSDKCSNVTVNFTALQATSYGVGLHHEKCIMS